MASCQCNLLSRQRILPPPILIKTNPQDTIIITDGADSQTLQLETSATNLSNVLGEYMDGTETQGKVFYLEGGKTYFLRDVLEIVKGFALKTNPEDLAAGKGRAKVCMGGLAKSGNNVLSRTFMLGRQPIGGIEGDGSTVMLKMDNVTFEDIDFDCPLAENYGDQAQGTGQATSNYFINEWSNHVSFSLKSVTLRNCSFQRFVRGFFRMQGSNTTIVDDVTIEGCEFYNCGYFDMKGGGYDFIHADPLNNLDSNILGHLVLRDNTFFDSSFGSLVTNSNRNVTWTNPNYKYNITIENNTFVNFNAVSTKKPLLDFRYTPSGSKFIVRNNLFVLTKSAADHRDLAFSGADIRSLQGACTDKTIFDFYNNWSTDDCHLNGIIDGQVFTASPFSATKNSFGAWLDKSDVAEYPHGAGELEVHVANIGAADLMYQPNPPHSVTDKDVYTPDRHRTDAIDGTGAVSANLYFKHFDNEIVKNNVGASKWRTKQETGIQMVNRKMEDSAVYNLAGQKISAPAQGVYIKNGKKYVR